MRKLAILGLAWTALAVLGPGESSGRTLVSDDFSGAPPAERTVVGGEYPADNTGKAWKARTPGDHLRYLVPKGGLPAAEGTVEVAFQPGPGPGKGSEAVCSFEWPGGKTLLTVYLTRTYRLEGEDVSILWLDGESGTTSPFGDIVSLDRVLAPGETAVLSLAWGGSQAAPGGFYLDGKPLRRFYSLSTGKAAPVTGPVNIGKVIAGAEAVRLGSDDRGKHPLVTNAIQRVAIHERNIHAVPGGAGLIRSVLDDSFKVPGISGKLVAGDKVTVEMLASPAGTASFDLGKVKRIAMEEVPPREAGPGIPAVVAGTYRGVHTIRPGDDFENGQVVGRFVSSDNVAAEPVTSSSKWTIDTKPRVTFSIDRRDLPADSSTKARIKVVAKDANGNPVKGRRLKLTLATTDQYTGTVGAGDFGKQVGGGVETRWRGETDSWGEAEFDYTAGFAAKTVILTAKDLDSGGTAVDHITAYKEASIDIALTKVISRAAVRRSIQYLLKVEASRTELTADGRSRSVIRATLLDPNGTSVAGDPVAFTLSSPNGTLRTIQGTTDAAGVATAEYTAGSRIGIVVVTATATLRNAQGQVSIILLADAPAKIQLKARPESLPADGVSRADISVKVTDANDNPNRDTKVDFRVTRGGGKLGFADRVTDRFGDASNVYTSGTEAGVATILATVRSRVPTEAELSTARNVLFVPYNPEGDEIRVEKWLKRKGDTVRQGEPLMEYTAGRSRQVMTLAAPYDLTLGDILVEYWNPAEVGQTLATVVPLLK